MSTIIPIPKIPISTRPGTLADVPFMDSLQKIHTKQVGWMPTAPFEGKIKLGHVLIAEEENRVSGAGVLVSGEEGASPGLDPIPDTRNPRPERVGYCIGNDQYFKRDDVGIIYQMNVAPGKQRGFVGATLLKAMFDRAAYGCRLFCCWCAQDIEANHFWESMGFVPLAFRAGSREKGRVHIFWQKRIRAGDTTTPWWFPSQTNSGSIREDRLVLPIPPGTNWRDVMPVILPAEGNPKLQGANPKQIGNRKSKTQNGETPTLQQPTRQRVQFGRPSTKPDAPPPPASPSTAKKAKPKRQKVKTDPRLVSAARELRDRWLEHANAHPEALGVPASSTAKYDVSRAIETNRGAAIQPAALLPAA